MKTTVNTSIKELATKFVTCKMNCDIEHNPTKILRLIGPDFSNISDLRDFIVAEKKRMNKENGFEFNNYYTPEIIDILDELCEEVVKGYNPQAIWSVDHTIGYQIVIAIKNNILFKKFNWNNYNVLNEAKLISLFPEFDTDFRGDITVCHKVGGKYVVIETESHPYDFDNQKRKTQEPKEKKFYSTEIRHERLCSTNTVFDTFESALFHTMFPRHYSAVITLFESNSK